METIRDNEQPANPALEVLEVLAEYKREARAIVDADLPRSGPDSAFVHVVELAGTLRAIDDLTLREWAREVIWRETRAELFDWQPPLLEAGRVPYPERVRLFVNAGYRDCPCCGRRFGPGLVREREIEAARGEAEA